MIRFPRKLHIFCHSNTLAIKSSTLFQYKIPFFSVTFWIYVQFQKTHKQQERKIFEGHTFFLVFHSHLYVKSMSNIWIYQHTKEKVKKENWNTLTRKIHKPFFAAVFRLIFSFIYKHREFFMSHIHSFCLLACLRLQTHHLYNCEISNIRQQLIHMGII